MEKVKVLKVKVLKEFRDKNNFSKVYSVGTVNEFEAERAKNIVSRGLGEYAENEEGKRPGRSQNQ
jgi:hypothetical protein